MCPFQWKTPLGYPTRTTRTIRGGGGVKNELNCFNSAGWRGEIPAAIRWGGCSLSLNSLLRPDLTPSLFITSLPCTCLLSLGFPCAVIQAAWLFHVCAAHLISQSFKWLSVVIHLNRHSCSKICLNLERKRIHSF